MERAKTLAAWYREHLGVPLEVDQTYGTFESGGPDPLSPRTVVRTHGDEVYVAETLVPRIEVIDPSNGTTRGVESVRVHRLHRSEP